MAETGKMTEEMQRQYDELAKCRRIKDALKAQKETLERKFEEDNKVLLDQYRLEVERVNGLEEGLRMTALAVHKALGIIHFEGGVEVKMFTNLDYKDAAAFNWAKEHRMALKLDKSAFEKIVKTSPDEFPWVSITKKPEAQLPKLMESAGP